MTNYTLLTSKLFTVVSSCILLFFALQANAATLSTTQSTALSTTAHAIVQRTIDGQQYLFVAAGESGLLIYEVSASDITLIGTYDTTGNALDLIVDDNYAYVADGNTTSGIVSKGHINIISIANPTTPSLVGDYTTPLGSFHSLALVGNTLYGVDFVNGLKMIDVADKANPTLLGTYSEGALGTHIQISSDGYAYILQQSIGAISVVSVADPAAMTLVSGYTADITANELLLDSSNPRILYISDGDAGLSAVDFSTMELPVLLTTTPYNTPGSVQSISFLENLTGYAVLADNTGGVQVINMNTLTDISKLASSTSTALESAVDTAVNGDTMYILSDGIYALDLSFSFTVYGSKSGSTEKITVKENDNKWCTIKPSDKEIGAKVFLLDMNGDGVSEEILEAPINKTKKPKLRVYNVRTCALIAQKKMSDSDKKRVFRIQGGNYYDSSVKDEAVSARIFEKDGQFKLQMQSFMLNASNKLQLKVKKAFIVQKKFHTQGITLKLKEGNSYPITVQAKDDSDIKEKFQLKKKDGDFIWKQKES